MILYCQDCGAVYELPDDPVLGLTELDCAECGARFRRAPGMSLDEFVAWLSFPPTPTAA